MDLLDELLELENDDLYENLFHMQPMELEQALISKKEFSNVYSVNRNHVNSKEYRDKFEKLPLGHEVKQAAFIQAGRLLEFVDGQSEERMLAINARTGEFLVDNFDRQGSVKGTGFNNKEMKIIDSCKDGIVIIHNHSFNDIPSAQDLITYFKEDHIKLSLIACHDGTLYGIYKVSKEFISTYEKRYQEYINEGLDKQSAKRMTTTFLYLLNDTLSYKHKLFEVHKF